MKIADYRVQQAVQFQLLLYTESRYENGLPFLETWQKVLKAFFTNIGVALVTHWLIANMAEILLKSIRGPNSDVFALKLNGDRLH